ncbi:MAG: DNA polymerase III subunit gamma/tau [Candidatus Yanofskybacteria bacterium]|nr:DNA polymerase III subunit gamma/tau [Candidatus Yanofskybacteria bacterium]
MANVVLYRKYRPQSFAEVAGQEHVVTTLRNAVRMGLLSHAYLFSGPRGTGKTTLARILAKTVNCKDPKNGEPCNTCEFCEEINRGGAIDLIEMDAASNRGIDEIRDLKDGARFAPSRFRYKVFVIDEAHQLTKDAANALLKLLEEPPSHVIIILATTEAHKMIPTIASRCQRFDFKKLTAKEVADNLESIAKQEGAAIDKEALFLIALQAEGSLRDAVSLLDKVLTFHSGSDTQKRVTTQDIEQLLGIVDANITGEFVEKLIEQDTKGAVEFLNQNLEKGVDPYEFAKNLVEYLRHILILKLNPQLVITLEERFTKEQQEKIQDQAKRIDQKTLTSILGHFLEAENKMKYASIIQLPLELAIVDSCARGK